AGVLRRVTDEGAWATPTLDAALGRAGLAPRDAGLATAITYGVLRVLPALDARIAALQKRPGKLDPAVRAILRVAAFQLAHLGRVPPHAVVDAAVRHAKAERGPRVAGFVNALCRRLAADRPHAPRPPERLLVPAWVEAALGESLGERAETFLGERPLPPPLGLRLRAGADAPPGAVPGQVAEDAAHAPPGDARALPGFGRRFVVQEEGSQLVGRALDVRPGEAVVDACAGRGGKTAQLAEATGAGGRVLALELHDARAAKIPGALAALGLGEVSLEVATVDLRVGTGGHADSFDAVLVDAPCSGLGTVHRRPEILLRITPDDIGALAATQAAILRTAATLVRPGGRLVYAVCSPLRAEGAAVADAAAEALAEGGLEPWDFAGKLPGARVPVPTDPDGALRLGPWLADGAGCDAYQLFRWRRRGVGNAS
ncbi:MAG: transcription antitermination factor NusB, partial [Myxococcota bacterium]